MVDYVPEYPTYQNSPSTATPIDSDALNLIIAALTELNNAVISMTQSAPGQPWQPASQKADLSKMRLWVGYDNPGLDVTVIMNDQDPVVLVT